jgi:alkylhydroperoxidase family enzyme
MRLTFVRTVWRPNWNSLTGRSRAIVAYGQAFFETHTVSPGIFQAALAQFGSQHLVELTQLMGQYTQTAFFLNAFAVAVLIKYLP